MKAELECLLLERSKDIWYCILECRDAPMGSYDWLNYATAHGPFTSEKLAREHVNNSPLKFMKPSIIKADHYNRLPDGRKEQLNDLIKYPSCPVVPFRSV